MLGPRKISSERETTGQRWLGAIRSRRMSVADIGAGHVTFAVFSAAHDGPLTLQSMVSECFVPDPALDAAWAEQVEGAIRRIRTQARFGASLSFVVPGHLALTKFITSPSVAKTKRGRVVQFEAAQNIPYRLEEVIWDYSVLTDDGHEMEIVLAAAKSDAMERMCAAVELVAPAIGHATPSAIALHDAFRFNYPEIKDSVLLASIGARTTQLLLILPHGFFVRTIALAGNTVTQAIAEALEIGLSEAETLKLEVLGGCSSLAPDAPQRLAVERAAESFCARLIPEIVRSALGLRRQSRQGEPTTVLLTGGGSMIGELPTVLGERLNLPIVRYDALKRVTISPAARGTAYERGLSPELIGLAAASFKRTRGLNLLPAKTRSSHAFRRRQPARLAAAALLVGALLPPLWNYQRMADANRAQLVRLDRRLEPLHRVQLQTSKRRELLARLEAEAAILERVNRAKSCWLIFFADLQSRFTAIDDVWLDRMTVLPDGARIPVGGAAANVEIPLRLRLSGELLDRENPVSRVSELSYARVKRLLGELANCRFVTAVEAENFDNRIPGILRFEVTLIMNRENLL